MRKAVGWVGEMYGFSIAACSLGMQFQLQELPLMIHPPFDQEVRARTSAAARLRCPPPRVARQFRWYGGFGSLGSHV